MGSNVSVVLILLESTMFIWKNDAPQCYTQPLFLLYFLVVHMQMSDNTLFFLMEQLRKTSSLPSEKIQHCLLSPLAVHPLLDLVLGNLACEYIMHSNLWELMITVCWNTSASKGMGGNPRGWNIPVHPSHFTVMLHFHASLSWLLNQTNETWSKEISFVSC